jgi:hypothetical protein
MAAEAGEAITAGAMAPLGLAACGAPCALSRSPPSPPNRPRCAAASAFSLCRAISASARLASACIARSSAYCACAALLFCARARPRATDETFALELAPRTSAEAAPTVGMIPGPESVPKSGPDACRLEGNEEEEEEEEGGGRGGLPPIIVTLLPCPAPAASEPPIPAPEGMGPAFPYPLLNCAAAALESTGTARKGTNESGWGKGCTALPAGAPRRRGTPPAPRKGAG